MHFFCCAYRPESASDAAECIRGHAVVVFLVVLFFFSSSFFLCICGHGVVVFPLRIFVCMDEVGGGGEAAACICGSRCTLVLVEQVNSVGEAAGGAEMYAAACTCGSRGDSRGSSRRETAEIMHACKTKHRAHLWAHTL